MTSKRKIILTTFFLLTLLFGLAQPIPVHAVLSIASITPNQVVNDIANIITITGTDLVEGSQVKVGGINVVTSLNSDATLTAIIPRGFLPGVYTVEVVNPDATSFSMPAALTVWEPTPVPTATQQPFSRPQVVVGGYSTDVNGIRYGKEFTLTVRLTNSGGNRAYGIQVTFSSPELLMLRNGGVQAVGGLNNGASVDIAQTMTAANYFYGQTMTAMDMNVSYYDDKGVPYSEKFTLILNVYNTFNNVPVATATPTGMHLSQLIISQYKTDLDLLQPGLLFTLEFTIKNMGDLAAKSVTMIVGGGSSSSGGGTPGPGGVSGSGGDFTNFAPVGTSNIQSLGDIPAQSILVARQQMIVNVNTNPGAYPIKVTFSYIDTHGNQVNDEQVITLLVYSLPNIDVNFYQPVSDLYTFQPNLLPLQVINLGRKSTILGNLTVTTNGGTVENGQAFVGALDPGGYFTLDVILNPETAGPVEVLVTIDYTDDFNQARSISKTLTMNVVEMPVDPSLDPTSPDFNGGIPIEQPETFWQKIWRFILGLLGLDSSAPVNSQPIQVEPINPQNIPIQPGGKG
jgi:hypothetical protein